MPWLGVGVAWLSGDGREVTSFRYVSFVVGRLLFWVKMGADELRIDVEYAMYRAPLLAAVLLSGFVCRGDCVEIPMPHPEAWREVIVWIYTGLWDGGEEVLENIMYLGGRV